MKKIFLSFLIVFFLFSFIPYSSEELEINSELPLDEEVQNFLSEPIEEPEDIKENRELANGKIILKKTLINDVWHIRCDVMDGTTFHAGGGIWKTDVIMNPTKQTSKEGHRSNKCGDADHWIIWLDNTGTPFRMDEIKSGATGGTLPTMIFQEVYSPTDLGFSGWGELEPEMTDKVELYKENFKHQKDITTIKPGERIYWVTWNGGQRWYHSGIPYVAPPTFIFYIDGEPYPIVAGKSLELEDVLPGAHEIREDVDLNDYIITVFGPAETEGTVSIVNIIDGETVNIEYVNEHITPPTVEPSTPPALPTSTPTPTVTPTATPAVTPTPTPTPIPTPTPTPIPTNTPTPTPKPTYTPTPTPSPTPKPKPTLTPIPRPTYTPKPTSTPTPTLTPTPIPTPTPTVKPTAEPTPTPTPTPTAEPTPTPTVEPTPTPTATPTIEPTAEPTATPTVEPTAEPTATPTVEPTLIPTTEPTLAPTVAPTEKPTPTPAPTPTQTIEPTSTPTLEPTPALTPTPTPIPTIIPTPTSTIEPTITPIQTVSTPTVPTIKPTPIPTLEPTTPIEEQTNEPSRSPTINPTSTPTVEPTRTTSVNPTTSINPTTTPTITKKPYAGQPKKQEAPDPTPTKIEILPVYTPTPTPSPSPTPYPTLSPEKKKEIITYIMKHRDEEPELMRFRNLTEEELEDLIDIWGYETPLFGKLLKTGDQIPPYVILVLSIGILSLILYFILRRKTNI